jgi:hypothetical protein
MIRYLCERSDFQSTQMLDRPKFRPELTKPQLVGPAVTKLQLVGPASHIFVCGNLWICHCWPASRGVLLLARRAVALLSPFESLDAGRSAGFCVGVNVQAESNV